MNFNIIKKIIETNKSFCTKQENINGFETHQFSYRIASYTDFKNPIGDNSLEAFELRGLTFVKHNDDYISYRMLHKFFNLNQTEGYMWEDVKDKKILKVQDKMDGSMIRFIPFLDGSVRAKTKYSFQAVQAEMAQKIYEEDPFVNTFVNWTLENRLAAIFELVSPFNKIVLPYAKTELRLLQIREEETGRYLDIDQIDECNDILKTETLSLSWDDLLSMKQTEKDIEGWVVILDDGQLIKVKTDWYLSMHRLLTENVNQTNFIIHSILDETIDDALSAIPEFHIEVRDRIEKINQKVVAHWNQIIDIVSNKVSKYNGDRKSFAIEHKEDLYFPLYMTAISKNGDENLIQEVCKDWIKKQTSSMEKAEKYLELMEELYQDIGRKKIEAD